MTAVEFLAMYLPDLVKANLKEALYISMKAREAGFEPVEDPWNPPLEVLQGGSDQAAKWLIESFLNFCDTGDWGGMESLMESADAYLKMLEEEYGPLPGA